MRETTDAANGIHMAFSVLEKRCSFAPPSGGPDGGSLKISKVTKTDAGSYKCRIDFANSPTQQYKVTLSLIGNYLLIVRLNRNAKLRER